MAIKINVNRYRLITLLYVVFVTLTVLNIPTSLLESSYYSLIELNKSENILLDKIEITQYYIDNNIVKINSNSIGNQNLIISDSIHNVYVYLKKIDDEIIKKVIGSGRSIKSEITNTQVANKVFEKDNLIFQAHEKLSNLAKYLIISGDSILQKQF